MLLDELKSIVGSAGWLSDPHDLQPYLTEWRGTWQGSTPLMVMPASVEEVAAIVKVCAKTGTGIVPQGGNTGLCGGAIPQAGEILLSLRRMRRIRSLDAENFSMVAEAGCVLADLQNAATAADRFFPLSLSAEGSCQIGGNLSTNAGGINVLRYGTARDQTLGLEVVLPDGEVVNGLRALRKDTAGYDLKQLFIGAEGTLGVITAASLKLYPRIGRLGTALVALDNVQNSIALLAHLRRVLTDRLQAFELMSHRAVSFATRHVPGVSCPLKSPWLVLLDAAVDDDEQLQQALAAALQDGLFADAAVAKNEREYDDFWRLRHSLSAAQKPEGASLKHDVSVPVSSVSHFIESATARVEKACPGVRIVAFGHVGDGNIHFNLSQPVDADPDQFLEQRSSLARLIYDVVAELGGSFSAEHGIGVLKRAELARYRGVAEVRAMQAVKTALDPLGIMNPGKVL